MMATASVSERLDPAPAAAPWVAEATFARGRGWGIYLVLVALLIPVLKPTVAGPQATIVDAVNALAMMVFGCVLLARRPRLQLPLIVPVALISVASLVAAVNTDSFSKCALTMIQDTYLYLWFLFMVAILTGRGDQRGVRVAWVWGANVAAGIGLYLLLTNGVTTFWKIFGAKGFRAVGLFNGPNELADYMMMSLFVVLSLSGQSRGLLVFGSLAFQLVALIATKSNGAISSLLLGLMVWGFLRALTRTGSLLVVTAMTTLLVGVLGLGWWVAVEWDLGGASIQAIQQQSFMGRFEQSAEGREHIWQRLVDRYSQSPLGIGPGNSSEQRLSAGHRERRKSQRSKEAHNDYLGYLVERGPVGLLGMMFLVILPFVAVWKGFRKVADRRWRAGAEGAIAAALTGGLVATTFHSLTMEKLHFRHYWLFLAIVFAFAATPAPRLALAGARRRSRRESSRRVSEPFDALRAGHLTVQSNGVHPEGR